MSNVSFSNASHVRFASIATPSPSSYAVKAFPPEGSGPKTSVWVPSKNPKKPFIAWNHLSGSVVHALTVFKDEQNRFFARFLVQNRPAMGNIDTVEAPAGKYGDSDPNETAEDAAGRELTEETGLVAKKVMMLSDDVEGSQHGASIATSPGITNERKAFALILAEKVGGKQALTESEKQQNVRQLDVPLSTILSPRKFKAWLSTMKSTGKLVGVDIPTLRGLLPARAELKRFLTSI